MKYILFLSLFLGVATAQADGFQNDANKPVANYLPYHSLLLKVNELVQGAQVASNTPLPNNPITASPADMLRAPLSALVAGAYHVFADPLWTVDTVQSTWNSGGVVYSTTEQQLQIKGSNPFTGERYDSGKVTISSSQGVTTIGIIVVGIATGGYAIL